MSMDMRTYSSRRGSILLFCLALVSALAVLAYGFVRVAQLSRASGDSSNMHLLAREAAMTGTQHAIEQIVRDFVNEPVSAMDSPAIRVFAPHDFPWGQSNSMATDELSVANTTGGARGVNRSDMPALDAFDKTQQSFSNGSANERMIKEGYMATNGRGRFYEPEFYNLAPIAPTAFNPLLTGPDSTLARPIGAVRFSDSYAAAAPPDRNKGIFYDERLRPIGGAPGLARDKARYRLRYAVVNTDLEGQMLVTGDPAISHTLITNPDPRTVADRALARILRNMHKVPAIVDAHEYFSHGEANVRFQRGGAAAGVAAEHVFIGRGSTANVDRQRDVNANAPSTFPLMYRLSNSRQRFGATSAANCDGTWQSPSFFATTSGSPLVQGLWQGGEQVTSAPSEFQHNLIGPQYSFFNWLHATYGNASEGVNERGMACFDRYTPFGRGVSAVQNDSSEAVSRYRGNVDTPWCINVLTATPRLVYAMIAGYMPPGAICLSYTRTAPSGYTLQMPVPVPPALPPTQHPFGATTIYVQGGSNPIMAGDLVTFPNDPTIYQVLSSVGNPTTSFVIAAPGLLNNGAFTPDTDEHKNGDAVNVAVKSSRVYSATRTRDLFVDALSPAFSRYHAPTRLATGPNPTISPDYHVDDFWKLDPASTPAGAYRKPDERYPGVLAFNGYPESPTHVPGSPDMLGQWQHDSLGYHLRSKKDATSSILAATDPEDARVLAGRYRAVRSRLATYSELSTHAYKALWSQVGHSNTGGVSPTAPDTMTQLGSSIVAPHPDSIWEVTGQAMAAAISAVQGQHFLYPTWKGNTKDGRTPATWFDGGTWAAKGTGAAATDIQSLDRLFVSNLGSNFDMPNDPTPVKVWAANTSGVLVSFTPDWNLAMLNDQNPTCMAMATNPALMPTTFLPIYSFDTYTATQRSQVAELIINDMRMSFFGASPYYTDFRVLDLNGDGKAACSVYRNQKAAGDPEHDLGIDQYTTAVDANGVSDPIPADHRASSPAAEDGIGRFFSNTGCFYLGKSRFWHIMVRGEVWDNVLGCSINRAQLDSVLCVDPIGAANEVGAGTKDPAKGQCSTHMIYQSWILDGEREFVPRRY
jgi:hypothetical protein